MTYKVTVKVLAEVEYEVTVDAASEWKAEDIATAMWREKTPEDFQVEKGYITSMETEAEQLTWECVECGQEMSVDEYRKNDELCRPCFLRMEAEDAA